jgi:FtsH-binding integral membrane protein
MTALERCSARSWPMSRSRSGSQHSAPTSAAIWTAPSGSRCSSPRSQSSSDSTSSPPRAEQLAIGLLSGLGLLLGLAVAPVIADYANADPSALWQAAGATAAFVAGTGAYGYATRRDLSSWGRRLFWALLGLIAFGIVAIFVSIPNSNIIYAVAGLGIFGAFTIFDFNRLRRSTPDAAVPIAAGIFLDVFNVFLLALDLFGGRRD